MLSQRPASPFAHHRSVASEAAFSRRPAPFHLLRAGIVAVGMLSLGIAAHSFSGGALPPEPLLAAILALVLLVAVFATRFRLRLPAMTLLLGVGQLALHEAFSYLSVGAPMTMPGMSVAHQHNDSAALATALQHLGGTATMDMHSAGGHSPFMLLGHILATAAMALMLAKGEATLWALASWLRPLFKLLRLTVPQTFRAPEAPRERPLPRLPLRSLRRDRLRGPPHAVVL
ncbi:hypothetical protein [Arthrobacter sp. NPDC090010]|uniref:hypothetical protein n=1 Tax=Arthrobacter sp. NPDC090010 TaxID=3363942 RepID=UPI0038167E8C